MPVRLNGRKKAVMDERKHVMATVAPAGTGCYAVADVVVLA